MSYAVLPEVRRAVALSVALTFSCFARNPKSRVLPAGRSLMSPAVSYISIHDTLRCVCVCVCVVCVCCVCVCVCVVCVCARVCESVCVRACVCVFMVYALNFDNVYL